ncbi:MAG: hypothetical protein HEEMFOPI_01532 [Holosporales bacterium]
MFVNLKKRIRKTEKIIFFFLFFIDCCIGQSGITTEVSLGLLCFDYNGYKGMKVNIDVYEGTSENRSRLWVGTLKFTNPADKIDWTNWRKHYKVSQVRFYYNVERLDHNEQGSDEAPTKNDQSDFIYGSPIINQKKMASDDIVSGNYISWRLEGYKLKIKDVIDCVNKLRDTNGNFPKYKFTGWDCDTNVANCVTFSTRFIKELGVDIEKCEELNSWIIPPKPMAWYETPKYIWYCSIRILSDNIQPQYVIKEIHKNKDKVLWRREGKTSLVPIFFEQQISDSLSLEGMN